MAILVGERFSMRIFVSWTTLSTDIWYLWQVSRCPSRHPRSSSTTFRASGILGAHLWSLLYTSMHLLGCPKDGGKPQLFLILWRIIKKWSHVMSCWKSYIKTWSKSPMIGPIWHSSDRNVIEMCVCVFSFMFTSIASSKNRNANHTNILVIHDFTIFFWGFPIVMYFLCPRFTCRGFRPGHVHFSRMCARLFKTWFLGAAKTARRIGWIGWIIIIFEGTWRNWISIIINLLQSFTHLWFIIIIYFILYTQLCCILYQIW